MIPFLHENEVVPERKLGCSFHIHPSPFNLPTFAKFLKEERFIRFLVVIGRVGTPANSTYAFIGQGSRGQ
jgi:hypothetical protein